MTDSEILSRPRFEIRPTEGADERAGHLPSDAKVAVTSSPGKGIETTLHFSERLLQHGFRVVPHIAARLVSGEAHDEELDRALLDKQPFASYVVTQICFDADTILRWISGIRRKGIRLPVYVGLPGAVDRRKLLRVSLKVGVGDSVRFLRKQTGLVGMLLKPGGYSPDELVERLAPYAGDEHYDIVGLHLYTFNQVESTEQWRQRMLDPKKASDTGAPR